MEVRYEAVGNRKIVGGEDKLIGPPVIRLNVTVGAYGCFECAQYRCAYSAYFVSLVFGGIELCDNLGCNNELLRVQFVLGEILHLKLAEKAQSRVECNKAAFNALYLHTFK